eukprot:12402098-Karenia_brevis.AAC.1
MAKDSMSAVFLNAGGKMGTWDSFHGIFDHAKQIYGGWGIMGIAEVDKHKEPRECHEAWPQGAS